MKLLFQTVVSSQHIPKPFPRHTYGTIVNTHKLPDFSLVDTRMPVEKLHGDASRRPSGAGRYIVSQCDLWAGANVVSFCTFSFTGPARQPFRLLSPYPPLSEKCRKITRTISISPSERGHSWAPGGKRDAAEVGSCRTFGLVLWGLPENLLPRPSARVTKNEPCNVSH